MSTTVITSKQIKIYAAVALAALLMTLLAVSVTAGQAQATTTDTTTITTDDNNNPIPQQQTTPTPEACPGETGNTNKTAASVVDSGHYALFDVWWNDEEGELTNNVCPPSVVHVPGDEDEGIAASDTRSPSSIDITAEPPTIIHIPSSAKINLSDSTTYVNGSRTYTYKEMYSEVLRADNLEDRADDHGTPVPGRGDGVVWALPACPPDGSPSADDLCLSFSAALLNSDDWLNADGSDGGAIDYLVHHVRHSGSDKKGYVLVYDVPASGATKAGAPLWNSHDAREGTVTVTPGEYSRPLWFFTERGTYEFKVYSRGYPNTSIGRDLIVTSDVREYIIHVGDELTVNKPPAFLVERSVAENSATGIAVGESIAMHDPDGDALSFRLSGPGSELFALSGDTDGNGRFTKPPSIVAATNTLDHEVRPQYLLTLHVSDGKGITGYADPALDNPVWVKINVTDVDEVDVGSSALGLKLIPSATGLKMGETVSIRAVIGDLPAGATNPVLRWIVEDPAGATPTRSADSQDFTRAFTYDTPGSRVFQVGLFYTLNGSRHPGHLSGKVTVTWGE